MSRPGEASLDAALRTLAPAGVGIAHRIIADGDEAALLPDEMAAFERRATRVRRQSGAARLAARALMAPHGFGTAALPRSGSGAPIWPPGLVGSLAHDDDIAIAALARTDRLAALGIDIEPAVPLPAGLVRVVATPEECRRYPADLLESRVLFTLKEAIFKALNPRDGVFLEFHDIAIDLDGRRGRTRGGIAVDIAFIAAPRVVALAFSGAGPS